jgi:hypothetical protein
LLLPVATWQFENKPIQAEIQVCTKQMYIAVIAAAQTIPILIGS